MRKGRLRGFPNSKHFPNTLLVLSVHSWISSDHYSIEAKLVRTKSPLVSQLHLSSDPNFWAATFHHVLVLMQKELSQDLVPAELMEGVLSLQKVRKPHYRFSEKKRMCNFYFELQDKEFPELHNVNLSIGAERSSVHSFLLSPRHTTSEKGESNELSYLLVNHFENLTLLQRLGLSDFFTLTENNFDDHFLDSKSLLFRHVLYEWTSKMRDLGKMQLLFHGLLNAMASR